MEDHSEALPGEGKRNFKATLLSRVKAASAQSRPTVDGPAELSKVAPLNTLIAIKNKVAYAAVIY